MAAIEGSSGGALSEIYQNSWRVLLCTRDALERLERLESTSTAATGGGLDSPELLTSIKGDVVQIQASCVEMDLLWQSIGAKSQRDHWRRKVELVAEESESLKESLDKYFLRNKKRTMEAKERDELLGRAKAQEKALDVPNNVGLSNTVLKLIERRHRVDTWIKYVGMISTVIMLYAFWRWTR